MDYKNMTAPCGLDCFNCLMYLAKNNEKIREMISQKTGIPMEKADCEGCRNISGKIKTINMTGTCSLYKCITKKGYEFCYECEDFPCDRLHPYADMAAEVPHNTKVFNLCLIKKMGLKKWAAEKAKDVKYTYFNGTWRL